jgi:hypothetical protein
MPPLQEDETRTEHPGYDPSEYNEGYTDQEHEEANQTTEEFIEELPSVNTGDLLSMEFDED